MTRHISPAGEKQLAPRHGSAEARYGSCPAFRSARSTNRSAVATSSNSAAGRGVAAGGPNRLERTPQLVPAVGQWRHKGIALGLPREPPFIVIEVTA